MDDDDLEPSSDDHEVHDGDNDYLPTARRAKRPAGAKTAPTIQVPRGGPGHRTGGATKKTRGASKAKPTRDTKRSAKGAAKAPGPQSGTT